MKKTHLVQLAAPLFTSCNVLIYYPIILAALLFIRLCAHLTALINKIDSESDDVMQCTNSTIISTSNPSLSGISSLYSSQAYQYAK